MPIPLDFKTNLAMSADIGTVGIFKEVTTGSGVGGGEKTETGARETAGV